MDDIEEQQKYLHQILIDARVRYEQEIRPVIDQLAQLELMKPPRKITISQDELASILGNVQ